MLRQESRMVFINFLNTLVEWTLSVAKAKKMILG